MNYYLSLLLSSAYMLCYICSLWLNSRGSYLGFVFSCSFSVLTLILLWILFYHNNVIIVSHKQEVEK